MTNHVILNSEQHKDLKIITERSEKYGDGVMYAMTFPFEFRNIQSTYPIFFHKNTETGTFIPVALFGFENNENLFLDDNGWNASYLPLMISRQPFLIGYQKKGEGDEKKEVVTIDMDSPRISKTEGEALFLEHGGSSEYLEKATQTLEIIHKANEHSERFVNTLLERDLLEPFALDVQLNDGSENQLLGFYTINEEKVQEMNGDSFEALNNEGFLQPIFMALASHSCIRTLVDFKNQTLNIG